MTFLTTVFFVLAALLMLGVMILVHEYGHFLAARLTGIPVKEFGIGFGPKIKTWKSKKHDTTFLLRLIPAGGYCMFYGEDDASGVAKDDPRNLNLRSAWRRMLTIFMGPMMNFVLAFIVAVCFYAFTGLPTYGNAFVTEGIDNGAAAEAGMAVGDVILAVDGQDAAGFSADGSDTRLRELVGAYREGGAPLTLTIERGRDVLTLPVAPRMDETEGRMLIGVNLNYRLIYVSCSPAVAITEGFHYCVSAGGAILEGLGKLVTTGDGIKDAAGPVGIISMITEETRTSGFKAYVSLLVLISVNLGLFNLLPIPGLDGSRIVFLLLEMIRRKPVPQKVEAYVHMAGYLLLIGLALILTYRDILKIFN